MEKIDRRQLLKAAAATGVGVAATALGATDAFAATASSSGPVVGSQAGARTESPRAGSIAPGVNYTEYVGTDFEPRSGTTTFALSGVASRYQTANADFAFARIQAPLGAMVVDARFYYTQVNAGNTRFEIVDWDPLGQAGADIGFVSATTTAPGLQTAILTFTPFPVDAANNHYYGMVWHPAAADSSNIIHGARLGWIQSTNLTLFPDPRRIVPNGPLTPSESFILNIDATTKVGGGSTGVPAGATAAFCAVQSYEAGVMTLYPSGTNDTGLASWSSAGANGTLQMLYMLVPLGTGVNDGHFNIHNRFTDKHIAIDVWGFLGL